MTQKYLAEFIGTFLLVSVVVGSGIMAENLSDGNNAVALLGNTIATGAILFVIIKMFGSISGAHFNPAVSLMFFLRKEIARNHLMMYILIQIFGGVLAVYLTHYIFELAMPLDCAQYSDKARGGNMPMLVSEILATTGLILTILFIRKNDESSVATGVALFITAGYWFTSSTSFANPAVTIARILTDTFTGISPEQALYFISGQIIGCFLGYYLYRIFEK
tara:strand:- start:541 stop:1200 length:660 start_codon:yes stop_codon:yes gene_type:complete